MSISPIGSATQVAGFGSLPALPALPTAPSAGDGGFGAVLSTGLERLEGMHDASDRLAVQAATGDLTDIHDYMIASTETSVATELTVAVRNKAVEAFTEIMRMQV
jgi:flagellar hook-basal body complex protein FliE